MTDVPQPPDGANPDQPKAKKPFVIPFYADIQVASPMRPVDAGVELLIEDQRVVVPVTEKQRLKLQQHPPEPDRLYRVSLWFRTVEGRVQNLQCFDFLPLKSKTAKSTVPKQPQFDVRASFKEVDREEGFVMTEVKPNLKTQLLASFDVQIWAAPDLINQHFYSNQTYLIYGQYDLPSGRLIAAQIKPMTIGKPMAPVTTKWKASSDQSSKSKKWRGKRWKGKKAETPASDEETALVSEDQSTVTSPEF